MDPEMEVLEFDVRSGANRLPDSSYSDVETLFTWTDITGKQYFFMFWWYYWYFGIIVFPLFYSSTCTCLCIFMCHLFMYMYKCSNYMYMYTACLIHPLFVCIFLPSFYSFQFLHVHDYPFYFLLPILFLLLSYFPSLTHSVFPLSLSLSLCLYLKVYLFLMRMRQQKQFQ